MAMKFVENGLLYDTDDAEYLGFNDDLWVFADLYRTKSGNFFHVSAMTNDSYDGHSCWALTEKQGLESLLYIVCGDSMNGTDRKERTIQRLKELFPGSIQPA